MYVQIMMQCKHACLMRLMLELLHHTILLRMQSRLGVFEIIHSKRVTSHQACASWFCSTKLAESSNTPDVALLRHSLSHTIQKAK